MPRTGARAEALSTLLTAAGFQPAGKPAAPRIRTEALARLYRQLGGIQEDPTLRPGSWDLAVTADDGTMIVVELDEELHFDRYRKQTLAAPWYDRIAWSNKYSMLCTQMSAAACRQAPGGSGGPHPRARGCSGKQDRQGKPQAPAHRVGSNALFTTPSKTSPRSPAPGRDSHASRSTTSSTGANLRLSSNDPPRAIRQRSRNWSSNG